MCEVTAQGRAAVRLDGFMTASWQVHACAACPPEQVCFSCSPTNLSKKPGPREPKTKAHKQNPCARYRQTAIATDGLKPHTMKQDLCTHGARALHHNGIAYPVQVRSLSGAVRAACGGRVALARVSPPRYRPCDVRAEEAKGDRACSPSASSTPQVRHKLGELVIVIKHFDWQAMHSYNTSVQICSVVRCQLWLDS